MDNEYKAEFMTPARWQMWPDAKAAVEVEHPKHYVDGRKFEPWDVIEDWKLNYFAGTALKYISRYERKGNAVADLKKAIEFLKRELSRLEK